MGPDTLLTNPGALIKVRYISITLRESLTLITG